MADEWRVDEEYFHNNQSDNNFYWELKMMNVKTFSNFVLIKKILTNNIVCTALSPSGLRTNKLSGAGASRDQLRAGASDTSLLSKKLALWSDGQCTSCVLVEVVCVI